METGNSRLLYVTGLAATLTLLAVGCRQKLESVEKVSPEQVIQGFTLEEYANGQKSWRLEAQEATIHEEEQMAELERITLTFFDAATPTVLRAQHGKAFLESHDMKAWGHVTVISGKDGALLETETLNFDAGKNRIRSEEAVTLKKGAMITRGSGFHASPDLSHMVIHNSRLETEP